jgi:phosphoribosylanthranilate isomerase
MSFEAKICGLGWPEDARVAEEAGADYLGVVFAPSPRQRSKREARQIWHGTEAKRAGVFVDAEEEQVLEIAHDLDLAVVQLHGSEGREYCQRLAGAGNWAVWKALRIASDSDLEAALEPYAECVGGILLEGWSAQGHGGVGAKFDWSLGERLRDAWPPDVRLVLAGGLNPDNVAEAIERIQPDVVDVSSGVETAPGMKDADAVWAFIEAVRRAGG